MLREFRKAGVDTNAIIGPLGFIHSLLSEGDGDRAQEALYVAWKKFRETPVYRKALGEYAFGQLNISLGD